MWALLLALATGVGGTSYVAAVLQHTHVTEGATPLAVKLANLRAYDGAMATAARQGAQLLVTPEVGLGHDERSRQHNAAYGEVITNSIPSNPCLVNSSLSPATNAASCMARARRMALVVGTIDLQPCNNASSCPKDGQFVYNTALAFNSRGDLVAKYHKFHLFTLCPDCFDHPPVPQECHFDLGLGVQFGMFICFDSLFPEPATKLISMGIRDFIFPTSWENLPPLLTATSWQQGWSRKFNATLLAANNGAGGAKSGSGIYQYGTPLASYFNSSSRSDVLMIARVNTDGPNSNVVPDPLVEEAHVQRAISLFEPACGFLHCQVFRASRGASGNISLSRGNVSCTMTYKVGDMAEGDYYALAVHSGLLWFGEFLRTDFCALVHCDGGPLCLTPNPFLKRVYETKTLFDHVTLQVHYSDSSEAFFPLLSAQGGNVTGVDKLVVASGPKNGQYVMSIRNQSAIALVAWGLPWE